MQTTSQKTCIICIHNTTNVVKTAVVSKSSFKCSTWHSLLASHASNYRANNLALDSKIISSKFTSSPSSD